MKLKHFYICNGNQYEEEITATCDSMSKDSQELLRSVTYRPVASARAAVGGSFGGSGCTAPMTADGSHQSTATAHNRTTVTCLGGCTVRKGSAVSNGTQSKL